MGKVGIIGVGQSKFVRKYPGSIRVLAFEGFKEAIADAGITATDIDASVLCSAPENDKQRSPSAVIAEYLRRNPQPPFYVESLCSSSNTGRKRADSMVAPGVHDVVAVIGLQKMAEISSAESQERMGRRADIQWESLFATMLPAYYAMHAQAHMDKYGTTLEDLAAVRVEAATYGPIKDRAVYRKAVTSDMFNDPEHIMGHPVSRPLRVGDYCANADGGLLSKGHLIGATGRSRVRKIVMQLRGEAGDMQVKDPEIELGHNIGGVGICGKVTTFGNQ